MGWEPTALISIPTTSQKPPARGLCWVLGRWGPFPTTGTSGARCGRAVQQTFPALGKLLRAVQGMAGVREVGTQVWELYKSIVHAVTKRVPSGLLLSALTFYRQTGTCRAWIISSRTFGPSLLCLFLCPEHLEKGDKASPCPASAVAPACTPNHHPEAPWQPPCTHHLRAGGVSLLELAGLAPPCRPGPHGSASRPMLLRTSFVSHCDCTRTHT